MPGCGDMVVLLLILYVGGIGWIFSYPIRLAVVTYFGKEATAARRRARHGVSQAQMRQQQQDQMTQAHRDAAGI